MKKEAQRFPIYPLPSPHTHSSPIIKICQPEPTTGQTWLPLLVCIFSLAASCAITTELSGNSRNHMVHKAEKKCLLSGPCPKSSLINHTNSHAPMGYFLTL